MGGAVSRAAIASCDCGRLERRDSFRVAVPQMREGRRREGGGNMHMKEGGAKGKLEPRGIK